jgi:aspartate/methionine/tyrosine aminotransferase
MIQDAARAPAFTASSNVTHLRPGPGAALEREMERRRAAGDDVADLTGRLYAVEAPRCATEATPRGPGERRTPPADARFELAAAGARYLSLLSGGRPVNADHLFVTAGAAPALFGACFVLFGPGDRVLVPQPAWSGYATFIHLAGATPVAIPGDPEWSLKIGVEELEYATDSRTVGVVLGSPVNPTGAVYTRTELKGIAEWAERRGMWVVLDESHRRVHYGSGPAPSGLDLPDELVQRVVVVAGLRTLFGEFGWRVALTVAPRVTAATLGRLFETTGAGVPPPIQRSAAQTLTDPRLDADVDRVVQGLRFRRDEVVRSFRGGLGGVEFVEPLGGHHFFFRADRYFGGEVGSALGLAERALTNAGVGVSPGESFGDPRWIRLSYAAPDRDVRRGLERLTAYLRTLERS